MEGGFFLGPAAVKGRTDEQKHSSTKLDHSEIPQRRAEGHELHPRLFRDQGNEQINHDRKYTKYVFDDTEMRL